MRELVFSSLLLTLPFPAQADTLLLNDLRAQNAAQISVDELKQLMPGAKVISRTEAGSTRRWSNDADGTFIASTDGRGPGTTVRGAATQGRGTWHVGDNGTYCVTLEWRSVSENWCRYIFRVADKYYGVGSLANGAAKAHEFEFSK